MQLEPPLFAASSYRSPATSTHRQGRWKVQCGAIAQAALVAREILQTASARWPVNEGMECRASRRSSGGVCGVRKRYQHHVLEQVQHTPQEDPPSCSEYSAICAGCAQILWRYASRLSCWRQPRWSFVSISRRFDDGNHGGLVLKEDV